MNKEIEDFKKFQKRAIFLGLGKAIFTSLLIGKLYYLQVLNRSKFGKLSETNRIKVKILYPERGIIFDSLGKKIAHNRIDYQLAVLKERKEEIDQNIYNLKKIINVTEYDILQIKKKLKKK